MAYWNKRGGGLFVPKAGPSKSSWVDAPREGWTDHQLKPENRERLRNCKEYDWAGAGAEAAMVLGRRHTTRKERLGGERPRLVIGFALMGAEDE